MVEVKQKKAKKQKVKKIEFVEDGELEELDDTEEIKKVEKDKIEDKKGEEEKPKKKKVGKIFLVILLFLLVLGGGGFALKTVLTKTTVTTETVRLPEDARGFSNYFKEYITDRVRAEKLISYSFRNLSNNEILNELSELKDGFSKVSRGVSGSYNKSEYKELANVMESDSTVYLTMVRELRAIMTGEYENDGDRQLAFMRKAEELTPELRSALYLAKSAFTEDVSGLSSKGVILFEGLVMVEVGGGVMNILVGDSSASVAAVTTDDIGGTVKRIEATGVFGYTGARVFRLGEGFEAMLEEGWVKDLKADVKMNEVDVTTTRVSTVMKNVWGLDEELKTQGIRGLVSTDKGAVEESLDKVVKGLAGK